MSKTALLDALHALDLPRVRAVLRARPDLRHFRDDRGYNLLQLVSKRVTAGDVSKQKRQLALARWLAGEGFDPRERYLADPDEPGEEPAYVSLAWFAVAKAQNTALARYFLGRGADAGALFAAAWWGNAGIIPDLVRHGANVNEVVGATPLHMAVAVVTRGTAGKPALARRRRKVVTELLRLGADPNIVAHDGTTPLHTALNREYLDVFRILVKHGANPDVAGPDGRTVRDIASRKRNRDFADVLAR